MDTLDLDRLSEVKKWLPLHCLWTMQFVNKRMSSVFWTEKDRKDLSQSIPVPGCLPPKNILAHFILIERSIPVDSNNNNSSSSNKVSYVKWFLNVTKYEVNSNDLLYAVQSGDYDLVEWLEGNTDAFLPPDKYLLRAAIISKNNRLVHKCDKICNINIIDFKYNGQKDELTTPCNCYDYLSYEEKLSKMDSIMWGYYHEGNHPIDIEFLTKILRDNRFSIRLIYGVCKELIQWHALATNNINLLRLYEPKELVMDDILEFIRYACVWTREKTCEPVIYYYCENRMKDNGIDVETYAAIATSIIHHTIKKKDKTALLYWVNHSHALKLWEKSRDMQDINYHHPSFHGSAPFHTIDLKKEVMKWLFYNRLKITSGEISIDTLCSELQKIFVEMAGSKITLNSGLFMWDNRVDIDSSIEFVASKKKYRLDSGYISSVVARSTSVSQFNKGTFEVMKNGSTQHITMRNLITAILFENKVITRYMIENERDLLCVTNQYPKPELLVIEYIGAAIASGSMTILEDVLQFVKPAIITKFMAKDITDTVENRMSHIIHRVKSAWFRETISDDTYGISCKKRRQ
jgi:hypothetical protein